MASVFSVSNSTLSNTTRASDVCDEIYYSPLEKDLKRSAYFMVAVVGILSNLLVIFAAIKHIERKNLHHLIINMAVSDTIFISVLTYENSKWLFSVQNIYPYGLPGDILCKARGFLFEVSYRVSLVTLLVISIERFRATRLTFKRVRPYTMKKRIAVIFVCWFLPMCLYASYLGRAEFGAASRYCRSNFDEKMYIDAVSSFLTVVILGVTSSLSALTVQQLYTNSQKITFNMMASEQYFLRRQRQIKATVRLVMASTILYSCCWLPYLVYNFLVSMNMLPLNDSQENQPLINLNKLCIDGKAFKFFKDLLLPALNSCLSPYIYMAFLPDFREAIKKLFRC